jgi:hypothetical protein
MQEGTISKQIMLNKVCVDHSALINESKNVSNRPHNQLTDMNNLITNSLR